MRSKYLYIFGAIGLLIILGVAAYLGEEAWQAHQRDMARQQALAQGSITLYLYEAARDTDAAGKRRCSADALIPVVRNVGAEKANVSYAIALTLAGDITDAERAQGLEAVHLLDYVNLMGGNFDNGVLTLRFERISNIAPDVCTLKLARAQLEKTLSAYPGVTQIDLEPRDIFPL